MNIYNKIPNNERSLFGNILIKNLHLYWEIPNINSFAIVLFERQLLTLIASITNEIYNVDTLVRDLNVYLNIPDEYSNVHVVLPHTLFAESKGVAINSHYSTGEIQLYIDEDKIYVDFCNKIKKGFHSLLANLKNREFEL